MIFFLAEIIALHIAFWFLLSIIKKRNDVADVAWGLGFVLIAWGSLLFADTLTVQGILVTLLVSIWGTRLAYHIGRRHKGKPEDFRYATWRQEWGRWFYLRSFFQIYVLQSLLLLLVVSPVIFITAGGAHAWSLLDTVGVMVWVTGFLFESIGDAQLARFLKDPLNKGHLMQTGLWRYTRHPNYFGEVTQWWGLWLIALSVPYGALSIIGPLTITLLILKVSGVPLLEKKMSEHPEFADYEKRTSMFIPLPPRKI